MLNCKQSSCTLAEPVSNWEDLIERDPDKAVGTVRRHQRRTRQRRRRCFPDVICHFVLFGAGAGTVRTEKYLLETGGYAVLSASPLDPSEAAHLTLHLFFQP